VDVGFTEIKVKLGEDIKIDLARMKAIRKQVGPEIILRIDANQGWDVKESIRIAKALEELDIDLIEQPIPHWDLEGLRRVRDASVIPIAADESCHSPMDALKLTSCVDAMNIKLMKCGGIYHALKISSVAEAAGLFCMIGCMGESRIANAAGMHLAAAVPNIQKIDLDVTFFAKGGQVTGGFESEGGRCTHSEKPGLGIEIEDSPTIYDVFNVPLLIHMPGTGVCETISTAGGHLDVLPTLLCLLGIDEVKTVMFGQNLLTAESGFVCEQTHMSIGSFIDDEVFFKKPHNNIVTNYSVYERDTMTVLPPETYYERSAAARKRIEDCAALMADNDLFLS